MSKGSVVVFFLQLCALFAFAAGCTYVSPPYPPLLTADPMAPDLERAASHDDTVSGSCTLEIVDAQIAKGGIYVYVRAELGAGSSWMSVRDIAAVSFYDEKHQECPIEMQDADGGPIELHPQVKRSYSLAIVDFAPPPTYSLRDGSILQVFVYRTKSRIKPGWYDLKLSDAWESNVWWTKSCKRKSDDWSRIFVDDTPPDLTSEEIRASSSSRQATRE